MACGVLHPSMSTGSLTFLIFAAPKICPAIFTTVFTSSECHCDPVVANPKPPKRSSVCRAVCGGAMSSDVAAPGAASVPETIHAPGTGPPAPRRKSASRFRSAGQVSRFRSAGQVWGGHGVCGGLE